MASTYFHAALALAVLCAWSVPVKATPLSITAGAVFFQSQPGTILDIASIPEGFFGAVGGLLSDPIPSATPIRVGIQGIPTGPMGVLGSNIDLRDIVCWVDIFAVKIRHCVGDLGLPPLFPDLADTDTIVRLTDDLTLNTIGDRGTIEVEILSLSLRSQTPLVVTYGGGNASFFDVFLTLDPHSTQRRGSVIFTREGEHFGTFDSILPVAFELTFVNTDPGGPSAFGPITDELDLIANDVAFRVVPEPSTLILVGLGVFGLLLYGWRRR